MIVFTKLSHYTQMHAHLYIYKCIYVCINVNVCIHIYACMYTHKCMYIELPANYKLGNISWMLQPQVKSKHKGCNTRCTVTVNCNEI